MQSTTVLHSPMIGLLSPSNRRGARRPRLSPIPPSPTPITEHHHHRTARARVIRRFVKLSGRALTAPRRRPSRFPCKNTPGAPDVPTSTDGETSARRAFAEFARRVATRGCPASPPTSVSPRRPQPTAPGERPFLCGASAAEPCHSSIIMHHLFLRRERLEFRY